MPNQAPSTSDHFFREKKSWSNSKLRVLEKYIDAYMRKRGRSHGCVYYVDGFAGAGEYESGPSDLLGSPLRIERLASEISSRPASGQLNCIFTELRVDYFQRLSNALAGRESGRVQLMQGSFLEHLPSILSTIGGAPAIFFIDPFGVKGVTPVDLHPILQRPDTEILISFFSPRLLRLAGFEDSEAKDAGAKLRLVSRVLGEDPDEDNPEWLREYRCLNNGLKWEQWAAKRYAERLLEASSHLQYVVSYPIREKHGANPKYHLTFATRSRHPMPIMNDILCTEEDDLFDGIKLSGSSSQMSFLYAFRQSDQEGRLAKLVEEIHSYGLVHQGCSRDRLIEDFVFKYPAELKKKHYRKALDHLVQSGRAQFATGPKDSAPITFS